MREMTWPLVQLGLQSRKPFQRSVFIEVIFDSVPHLLQLLRRLALEVLQTQKRKTQNNLLEPNLCFDHSTDYNPGHSRLRSTTLQRPSCRLISTRACSHFANRSRRHRACRQVSKKPSPQSVWSILKTRKKILISWRTKLSLTSIEPRSKWRARHSPQPLEAGSLGRFASSRNVYAPLWSQGKRLRHLKLHQVINNHKLPCWTVINVRSHSEHEQKFLEVWAETIQACSYHKRTFLSEINFKLQMWFKPIRETMDAQCS
jgi:hypothetical protein